jgi:SAM-dependent methyltransferase
MDARTVSVYDAGAPGFCDDWLSQPPAQDLQRLWRRFLAHGAATVDVGSGSGRDVDWLNRNGYPCEGLDASLGLVAEARRRFPQWRFAHADLPGLAGVPAGAYANVVCETVIMHLPAAEVVPAVQSLWTILAPGGTLYLSWRIGSGTDLRDDAGRLYSAFASDLVRAVLARPCILYDAEETSESSSKRVHRLVARRPAA